jgi:hypothetical protein
MAIDWKVFSRHKAIVEPSVPAARAAASVTPITRATCPCDTPPSSTNSIKSGKAANTSTRTTSMLASSLPNTSSEFDIRVSKSSSNVRRSFSWATAAADSNAEKATAMASCTGVINANAAAPKRARSASVRTGWEPKRISHAVAASANKAPTYKARRKYSRQFRGVAAASRVNTGPTNKLGVPAYKDVVEGSCES